MSTSMSLPSNTEELLATIYPARAFFRPGEEGEVCLAPAATMGASMEVHVRVTDLGGTVAESTVQVREQRVVVPIALPEVPGRGYGVEVKLTDQASGRLLSTLYTALDVQKSWLDAPRYGFLARFGPGEEYEDRCAQLLARHITVVQFYDWMYRHYQYLPPAEEFDDSLGRRLSLLSVRRALRSVQSRGMSGMAYGALYGAEPEYAGGRQEELLYDEAGKALSLAERFYIMDLRPGPWRERILGEYRQAIGCLHFDGIHADQYGFPQEAWDIRGERIDLAPVFADIVGAAQQTVRAAGGAGVIFNAVRNWPIRAVAPVEQACSYIEVWPPYVHFSDLVRLVNDARRLAPARHAILAAYMSCAAEDPDGAMTATLCTMATINASGGFHLLLGEGDGMLVDPYYPNFVRPGPLFQRALIRYADFVVRYGQYLHDRRLLPTGHDAGTKVGGLLHLHRVGEGYETLSLINVDPEAHWDERRAVHPVADRPVALVCSRPVSAVYLVSPDGTPEPVRPPFRQHDGVLTFVVPIIVIWALVIIEYASVDAAGRI